MLKTSSADAVITSATALIHALSNTVPETPFYHIGDEKLQVLHQLSNILSATLYPRGNYTVGARTKGGTTYEGGEISEGGAASPSSPNSKGDTSTTRANDSTTNLYNPATRNNKGTTRTPSQGAHHITWPLWPIPTHPVVA